MAKVATPLTRPVERSERFVPELPALRTHDHREAPLARDQVLPALPRATSEDRRALSVLTLSGSFFDRPVKRTGPGGQWQPTRQW